MGPPRRRAWVMARARVVLGKGGGGWAARREGEARGDGATRRGGGVGVRQRGGLGSAVQGRGPIKTGQRKSPIGGRGTVNRPDRGHVKGEGGGKAARRRGEFRDGTAATTGKFYCGRGSKRSSGHRPAAGKGCREIDRRRWERGEEEGRLGKKNGHQKKKTQPPEQSGQQAASAWPHRPEVLFRDVGRCASLFSEEGFLLLEGTDVRADP